MYRLDRPPLPEFSMVSSVPGHQIFPHLKVRLCLGSRLMPRTLKEVRLSAAIATQESL